ncbi:MAG: type IV secretory system conjugative DNA transfer family protein, partial [Cyanobacteriota bacterium]|nr:type IV secretory system conjugative DNA transfer family protein [Cyanobacteriota bacterium]
MHSNNHWLPKTLASATQATEEQPSSSPAPGIDLLGMFEQFNNPQGYLMVGTLVILLALSRLAPRGSKITSGRVAGPTEHLAAASIALKQMKSKKHNKVTLWCGEPRYWFGKGFKGASARLQALLNNPSTLWLPDMQRSMLVIGQPGSGKSFSV